MLTTLAVVGVVHLGAGVPNRRPNADFVGEGPRQLPAPDTASPVSGQYATDPVALAGSVDQELMAKGKTLPVDVVVAGELRTSAGQTISLAMVGAIAAAYRSARGWLVIGSRNGGSSLWFVAEGGQPQPLLTGVDGLALAPDGLRLAWRAATKLYLGTLTAGRVETLGETVSQGDGVPVGFVGTGVLVASRSGERYAVWWPHLATYAPTWRHLPSGVYGALPDGRTRRRADRPAAARRSRASPCWTPPPSLVVRAADMRHAADRRRRRLAVARRAVAGRRGRRRRRGAGRPRRRVRGPTAGRRRGTRARTGRRRGSTRDTVVHAGPGHELVRPGSGPPGRRGAKDGVERIPVGRGGNRAGLAVHRLVG